jgi:hypothetical protein
VQDGVGRLLLEQTGGTPEHEPAAAAVLAQRAADQQVLAACVADTGAAPAVRVEPAFVLLAERLPAAQLGSALRLLLDPLQPDGTDLPAADPYYLELRVLADGDVDIRGLLDPETGQQPRRRDRTPPARRPSRRRQDPTSRQRRQHRSSDVDVEPETDVDLPRSTGNADGPCAVEPPTRPTRPDRPADPRSRRPCDPPDPADHPTRRTRGSRGPADPADPPIPPTLPTLPTRPTLPDGTRRRADEDPLLQWDQPWPTRTPAPPAAPAAPTATAATPTAAPTPPCACSASADDGTTPCATCSPTPPPPQPRANRHRRT